MLDRCERLVLSDEVVAIAPVADGVPELGTSHAPYDVWFVHGLPPSDAGCDAPLFAVTPSRTSVGSGSRATWTFQRVFDTGSLARPKLVSTFATESAVPGKDGRVATDGIYSVHNAVVKGDLEYVSWYSDGVRVVDLADPRRPREVAWFVPPPSSPRQTAATARDGRRDMPVVWGVYPWKDMVLASDMNSGLWVFRVSGDARAGNGAGPGSAGSGSGSGGSGSGGSGRPAPEAAPNPDPAASPAGDQGRPGVVTWAALAGLALGLLAVGAVARSARRRRS